MTIPSIQELFSVLASTVIQKPGRLRPDEVRFLRKHLGWSGEDIARTFGVTPESVSRWESGARSINQQADRLLRMCVARLAPAEAYPLEHLQHVALHDAPLEHSYRATRQAGTDWSAAGAAAN